LCKEGGSATTIMWNGQACASLVNIYGTNSPGVCCQHQLDGSSGRNMNTNSIR
jgi:hypothetical protein